MPGPTHTKTAREQRRTEVARLDRRGYTQEKIAELLGVSRVQICKDLQLIRKRYREVQHAERSAKVSEMAERYLDMLQELWEAWERSKEDAVTVTVEEPSEGRECPECNGTGKSPTDKGCRKCKASGVVGWRPGKTTRTTTGRLPAAEYMTLIRGTLADLRTLFGIDETADPDKDDTKKTIINWDVLIGKVEIVSKAEELERKITQAALMPPGENGNGAIP